MIPYINYIGMCSPKLHVEVNGFGLKKKGQADLMCKSNQRHLEPTLEYETTLPSPTNLEERIKMRSMHLYQTFSGIPTPTPTHIWNMRNPNMSRDHIKYFIAYSLYFHR